MSAAFRGGRPEDFQAQPAAMIGENPGDASQPIEVEFPGSAEWICRAIIARALGVDLRQDPGAGAVETEESSGLRIAGKFAKIVAEPIVRAAPVDRQRPGPAAQAQIIHPGADLVEVSGRLDEVTNEQIDAGEPGRGRDFNGLSRRRAIPTARAFQDGYMAILRGIDPETTLSSEVQGPSFRSGQTILLRAVAREEQGTLSLSARENRLAPLRRENDRAQSIHRSRRKSGVHRGQAKSKGMHSLVGANGGARQTKR